MSSSWVFIGDRGCRRNRIRGAAMVSQKTIVARPDAAALMRGGFRSDPREPRRRGTTRSAFRGIQRGESAELVGRQRGTEQEALRLVAAALAQKTLLRRGLHAFGDDAD